MGNAQEADIAKVVEFAKEQDCGTIATVSREGQLHATYVVQAILPNSEVIFVASPFSQHGKNILQNPNISLLIDNRGEAIKNPHRFGRLVIDGSIRMLEDGPEFETFKNYYLERHPYQARFFNYGAKLFILKPQLIKLHMGFMPMPAVDLKL